MKTLLVAFDGSESAERALRHAITLARTGAPATVHVVNAHEQAAVTGELAAAISQQTLDEFDRVESEKVLNQAESILTSGGVPYELEVLTGSVARRIAERGQELGCDGIIMGTHGRTALGNLLLGSVAQRVIHFTRIPVTLVK